MGDRATEQAYNPHGADMTTTTEITEQEFRERTAALDVHASGEHEGCSYLVRETECYRVLLWQADGSFWQTTEHYY